MAMQARINRSRVCIEKAYSLCYDLAVMVKEGRVRVFLWITRARKPGEFDMSQQPPPYQHNPRAQRHDKEDARKYGKRMSELDVKVATQKARDHRDALRDTRTKELAEAEKAAKDAGQEIPPVKTTEEERKWFQRQILQFAGVSYPSHELQMRVPTRATRRGSIPYLFREGDVIGGILVELYGDHEEAYIYLIPGPGRPAIVHTTEIWGGEGIREFRNGLRDTPLAQRRQEYRQAAEVLGNANKVVMLP